MISNEDRNKIHMGEKTSPDCIRKFWGDFHFGTLLKELP
jgi:hypothetical protein